MLWGDGFEIETLINIRVAGASLEVVEVPSLEHARMFGRSNLHAVSDGYESSGPFSWSGDRNRILGSEKKAGMAAILELHAPRLDREPILRVGELEYCGVADRSS